MVKDFWKRRVNLDARDGWHADNGSRNKTVLNKHKETVIEKYNKCSDISVAETRV